MSYLFDIGVGTIITFLGILIIIITLILYYTIYYNVDTNSKIILFSFTGMGILIFSYGTNHIYFTDLKKAKGQYFIED